MRRVTFIGWDMAIAPFSDLIRRSFVCLFMRTHSHRHRGGTGRYIGYMLDHHLYGHMAFAVLCVTNSAHKSNAYIFAFGHKNSNPVCMCVCAQCTCECAPNCRPHKATHKDDICMGECLCPG